MKKQPIHYNAEFKQHAINYYRTSEKTIDEVAQDLKVAKSTLGRWITDANKNAGQVVHRGSGNFASDAEKEMARLRKELKDAKDALDILKKAIGILNA
jgi:transposase